MPKKISGGLAFVIFIAIAIFVWLKEDSKKSPPPTPPVPATASTPTPASPAPAPGAIAPRTAAPSDPVPVTPATPTPTRTPTRDLAVASLINGDKESALLLICRGDALPWLVRAYGLGDEKIRQRALWCLRRMGELRRLYFNKILENQGSYNERTVKVVKDIINNLEPRPVVIEIPVEVQPNIAAKPSKSKPAEVLVKRMKRNVSGRTGYEKVWTKVEDLRPTDIKL